MEKYILIRNLTKTYGERVVLDIPEIGLEMGKIYAITGHNGSGKSTLGKLLGGIIKPDKGETEITTRYVAENIDIQTSYEFNTCYSPQKPYAFNMSLEKNILLNVDDKTEANLSKVKEIEKALNIYSLKDSNAKKLSGGELSKMALSRALIKKYDLVILDEPTAAMDMESTVLAEELMKKYVNETGATLIIISHEYDQVSRLADHRVHLNKGIIDKIE